MRSVLVALVEGVGDCLFQIKLLKIILFLLLFEVDQLGGLGCAFVVLFLLQFSQLRKRHFLPLPMARVAILRRHKGAILSTLIFKPLWLSFNNLNFSLGWLVVFNSLELDERYLYLWFLFLLFFVLDVAPVLKSKTARVQIPFLRDGGETSGSILIFFSFDSMRNKISLRHVAVIEPVRHVSVERSRSGIIEVDRRNRLLMRR